MTTDELIENYHRQLDSLAKRINKLNDEFYVVQFNLNELLKTKAERKQKREVPNG